MKIFGREIRLFSAKRVLQAVADRGGWFNIIREPFAGAWQRNVTIDQDAVISFGAVYACVTLIASDVAKMRLRLMEQADGVWRQVDNASPFWPVLRKPNRYQNRLKFIENWITSKLLCGNTYALKERDKRGIVVALYILDPRRVKPLVAEDGSVYYELKKDNLTGLTEETITVPASEIIHDTMVCLFHPLVGVSPIFACGLAATQGIKIQSNSAVFFGNMSRPGGILTAPASIAPETAARLKEAWDTNFGGANSGKVAVLGDGLKYEAMTVNAVDAQLIEQLRWTAENVCTAFHMPPWKIGVGPMPAYGNSEIGNQIYYSDCLQSIIESLELSLDEGLGLTAVQERTLGTEFNLHDLLRMDTATRFRTLGEGIKAGFLAPNEARAWEDLPPVAGGASPMSQQQNFSLAALAKRDAREDPFATATPAPKAEPMPEDEPQATKALPPPSEVEQRLARMELVLTGLPEQLKALAPPPADEIGEEWLIDFDKTLTEGLQAA